MADVITHHVQQFMAPRCQYLCPPLSPSSAISEQSNPNSEINSIITCFCLEVAQSADTSCPLPRLLGQNVHLQAEKW